MSAEKLVLGSLSVQQFNRLRVVACSDRYLVAPGFQALYDRPKHQWVSGRGDVDPDPHLKVRRSEL